MQFGLVVGNVVNNRKDAQLPNERMLVIRDLDRAMRPTKSELVVIDTVDAGPGDVVIYATGSSARMTDITWEKCVDGTIVGIVEEVTRGEKSIYKK